jgi:EAL domain-containing protein (putative c-di-GMP-specific phosphodiesterase class I)
VPLAEGIETEEEARTCVGMGVKLIQGYLTGRPIPVDAL